MYFVINACFQDPNLERQKRDLVLTVIHRQKKLRCCYQIAHAQNRKWLFMEREVSAYKFLLQYFFFLHKFDVVFDTLASWKFILARQLHKYV